MKLKVLTLMLAVMGLQNVQADVINSGISYANACSRVLDQSDSPDYNFCLGLFIGATKGYNFGFQAGIMYPNAFGKIDIEDPKVMQRFELIGEAGKNGASYGYCPRKGSTFHTDLSASISEIKRNPELHDIPSATAIIKALGLIYPCK
ncbi:hypothetical protein [Halioxenophilus aromaticivorans]|uniref:Rap1a immunity protein domain-containing protein n=1 Tax=Halioxenophilus aromaticivorans TaxID=1306992 RepID=A0AAV3TY63_9ALTE